MDAPLQALLAILAGTAALTDWKVRRIPNWLTIPSLVAALVLRGAFSGSIGVADGLKGAGLALLVTLPFFVLRGLGGGDVKLLVAAGAILGPGRFLPVFAVNAVLGGVAAVLVLAGRGRWSQTFRNIGRILASIVRGRPPAQSGEGLSIDSPSAVTLPRGVIFAVTVLLFLASGRW